ncbi:MAG TPA: clostripain-related cysteine peptidase [Elusimicrobiales bacterium]|nr:clostripain-related cysteine peptidase [Elusimicrobiales bacterium]
MARKQQFSRLVLFALTLACAAPLSAAPYFSGRQISAPGLSTPVKSVSQLQLPLPEKDWTITAFLSGKNSLSYDMLWALNQFELAGPSARVNMVVEMGQILMDRGYKSYSEWTGTRRYYLVKDKNDKKLTSIELPAQPYADLASPLHLRKYIQWSKANFPAKKHMLFFKNHGHGVRGISDDDRTKKLMSVPGLADAIRKAGGVDLLFLDACLMQTLEVVYELRGAAPTVVASEEFLYSTGFDLRKILASMNRNPNMKPETAAHKVMAGFKDQSPTASLVNIPASQELARMLDSWTQTVMSAPDGKAAAALAAKDVLRFGEKQEHADLMRFVHLVYLNSSDTALKKQSEALVRYYTTVMLGKNKTNDISGAYGLSIYLPPDGNIIPEYGNLAFTKETRWIDFLKWLKENGAIYGEVKPAD